MRVGVRDPHPCLDTHTAPRILCSTYPAWKPLGVVMAKNITLAIDEDLLDKVRVLAAMKRTSVNEMVREFLEREVKRETALASRAEAWARVFEAADSTAEQRERRKAGEAIFDREAFYDEVLRERRLL